HCALALDRKRTGAEEVGEACALFRSQQRVNGAEGGNQSPAQFGSAVDAAVAGSAGLARVEGLPRDGIGELGPRPPVVHLGLGPFDLEVVKDAGQLADLLVIQVELVREKAERTPDAPAASEACL